MADRQMPVPAGPLAGICDRPDRRDPQAAGRAQRVRAPAADGPQPPVSPRPRPGPVRPGMLLRDRPRPGRRSGFPRPRARRLLAGPRRARRPDQPVAGGSRRSDVGGTHQRHRPARPSTRPWHDHRRRRPLRGRDRMLPPDPVPAGGHRQPGDPDRRGAWPPRPARYPAPSQHTQPAMSITAVVLVVLTAAGFPLLLWALGRAVTAAGERAPHGLGRPRHYLAGRLDALQITALIDGGDELLISLTTPTTENPQAVSGPLAKVFRVTASECSLPRVRRWRDEGTLLRAYLSDDGALMLADPMLGGNAACEPATTVTWQAPKPAIPQDQSPPD